ncbi:NAD-dependent epimerase/dehydratase family protein [Denitromonas sp. IR12]|uniref:NAD-dependent epimerase/dehydratase family protein n=1 Tax=Denitromonas iodatirespirans TaxID=2795389 RepID=A0A944HA67_DENI1|nr:NAD-dependent epimerase/dehydratase family protein [Denitromonas iodatirespirans]
MGSNLTLALQSRGFEVTITGHESEQVMPEFKGKCLYPGILGIDWDEIGKVDVLFHQAAINGTRVKDEREIMRANLEASKALFDYAINNGCKRIVYASSAAVYGNNPAPHKESDPTDPQTPYAMSKKLLDDYAMALAAKHPDITIVGLRYCNIFGPGENHKGTRATMIYQFAQQMLKGNPRLFKHGEQKRDYIYVKDVVTANILASQANESCVVNCGSGTTTSFNQIVEQLNAILGLHRTPEYMDNPFEGAYQSHTECDMSFAKAKIGFSPEYSFEQGLADYYQSGSLV